MEKDLLCQECSGTGSCQIDLMLGYYPIYETCEWCDGTGKITPSIRGLWLRTKKVAKRENGKGFTKTTSQV